MDIRIKATDFEMTPETSAYLGERIAHVEKLLGREEQAARCEVEIGRAGGHHRRSDYQYFAEFKLIRPGFPAAVARNTEGTVNAAVDRAKEELLRQLRKEKTARTRKSRKEEGQIKRKLLEEE